jgi:hypothetical protein
MITKAENLTPKEIARSLSVLEKWQAHWGSGYLADVAPTNGHDLHSECLIYDMPDEITKEYG